MPSNGVDGSGKAAPGWGVLSGLFTPKPEPKKAETLESVAPATFQPAAREFSNPQTPGKRRHSESRYNFSKVSAWNSTAVNRKISKTTDSPTTALPEPNIVAPVAQQRRIVKVKKAKPQPSPFLSPKIKLPKSSMESNKEIIRFKDLEGKTSLGQPRYRRRPYVGFKKGTLLSHANRLYQKNIVVKRTIEQIEDKPEIAAEPQRSPVKRQRVSLNRRDTSIAMEKPMFAAPTTTTRETLLAPAAFQISYPTRAKKARKIEDCTYSRESLVAEYDKEKKKKNARKVSTEYTTDDKVPDWHCKKCGAYNSNDESTCKSCNSRRNDGEKSQGWGNVFEKFQKPGWKCPSCNITNDFENDKCVACATARPATEGPKGKNSPVKKPIVSKTTKAGAITSQGFAFHGSNSTATGTNGGFSFLAPAPSSGGFTFKASAVKPSDSSSSPTPITFGASQTGSSVSFGGTKSDQSSITSTTSKPTFSFGTQAGQKSTPQGNKSTDGSENLPPSETSAVSDSVGFSNSKKRVKASEPAFSFPKGPKDAATVPGASAQNISAGSIAVPVFGVTKETLGASGSGFLSTTVPSSQKQASSEAPSPAVFGKPMLNSSSSSKSDGASRPPPSNFEKPFGIPKSVSDKNSTSTKGLFGNSASTSEAASGPVTFAAPEPAPGKATSRAPESGKATSEASGSGKAAFAAPSPAPATFGAPSPAPATFGASAPTAASFGAAPATSGASAPAPATFGVSAPAPAALGASAPAPSTFGASAPAPSTFGAAAPAPSTFGAAAPAPSTFGAPAPATFGAAAPAPATFGAPAPAPATFGAPAPAPSTFGAPAPAPPTFGASAPAPPTFGAPASATVNAPAPGFRASASSITFGASGAAFGTATPAPAATGAPFGAPSPATFGASAPGPFGSAAPTTFGTTPPATFGAPAPAGKAFNASATPGPAFGSSAPPTAPPAAPFAFGNPIPPAFGSGTTPAPATSFGTSAPPVNFGAPVAASASFGNSNPTPAPVQFGAAPSPAPFGNFNNPSQQPAFGAPAPPAPTFGAPAPAASGFGTQPGFGAAPTFGAPPPAPATGTGFGSQPPSFGGQQPAGFSMGSSGARSGKRRIIRVKRPV